MLCGEVLGLRDVVRDVIQLPDVIVERCIRVLVVIERSDRMKGDGLPAVVIYSARAEHLEVLRHVPFSLAVPTGRQEVSEARTVDDRLVDAVKSSRNLDRGQLDQRRQDVDSVGELAPDPAVL